MDISHETPEQTHQRLLRVIAQAELKVFPGLYTFTEYALNALPQDAAARSLALVRDDEVWSALQPATAQAKETFSLFSFHFKEGLDNSGFVGWLATHIKQTTGSGILVVCGYNHQRGGVFDYWGAPAAAADKVLAQVRVLREQA
jgi:Family of unknown function (DUF6196)